MKYEVSKRHTGLSLLLFLTEVCASFHYSKKFLKRAIDQGLCEINGKTERFSSSVLYEKDVVRVHFCEESSNKIGKKNEKEILFEDNFLVVYNKPARLACDEQGVLSLFPGLRLVHRLDKDTTGLLLLAKDEKTFQSMVHLFKSYGVQKTYRAIVDKTLRHQKGKIENYLIKKQSFAGQSIWGATTEKNGLYACTEWVQLRAGKNATLVACFPKTGRTHQIRVHFAEMGHPLLGDFQYGKHFSCTFRPSRYLLHAQKLAFLHPFTNQPLEFEAPLPQDFKEAEAYLFNKKEKGLNHENPHC